MGESRKSALDTNPQAAVQRAVPAMTNSRRGFGSRAFRAIFVKVE